MFWTLDQCLATRMVAFVITIITVLISASIETVSTCEGKECDCNREDWLFFEHGNRYIKMNAFEKSFSMAASMCKTFGGQLLAVADQETQLFVRNISDGFNQTYSVFWVVQDQGMEQNSTVLDGETLDSTPARSVKEECAAITFTELTLWTVRNCSDELYHFCEAYDPCIAWPVMSLNEERVPDKIVVTVTNDKHALFKCVVLGARSIVSGVKAECGNINHRGIGKYSVTLTFRIDIQFHNRKCVCLLSLNNGKKSETLFTIYFQTRPRMVNEKENNQTVLITVGFRVIVDFILYANPKPLVNSLTKIGSGGLARVSDDHNVTITPQTKALHYSVRIMVIGSSTNQSGAYQVTIGNGIASSLVYTFRLTVKEDTRRPPLASSNTMAFTVIGLLVLGSNMVIGTVICLRDRELCGYPDDDESDDYEEYQYRHRRQTDHHSQYLHSGSRRRTARHRSRRHQRDKVGQNMSLHYLGPGEEPALATMSKDETGEVDLQEKYKYLISNQDNNKDTSLNKKDGAIEIYKTASLSQNVTGPPDIQITEGIAKENTCQLS